MASSGSTPRPTSTAYAPAALIALCRPGTRSAARRDTPSWVSVKATGPSVTMSEIRTSADRSWPKVTMRPSMRAVTRRAPGSSLEMTTSSEAALAKRTKASSKASWEP
ncbi:hypothetical protein CMsap09_10515 [Clavibacter michiganensis]|uniref:Uncharacterized protein n=1 Tax=Clavibacter michiganensis TaxID=28447 RepID=A0A251XV53_9MICO|nr:hypothetical protein CMsap09_10515 [Clavibacter michiganensis]